MGLGHGGKPGGALELVFDVHRRLSLPTSHCGLSCDSIADAYAKLMMIAVIISIVIVPESQKWRYGYGSYVWEPSSAS